MHMTPDPLTYALVRCPDRPAVVSEDRELTYRQLDRRARQLVQQFRNEGLQKGDVIALLAKNQAEYFELNIAAIRCGAVLLSVNFRLALPELEHIVGDSEPAMLVFAEEFSEAGEALRVDRKIALGKEYDAWIDSAEPASDARWDIDAEASFAIQYTSGTSGRPKGAVMSNYALHARMNSSIFEYRVRPDTRFLMCLQLFHIGSVACLSLLYVGATVVIFKDFDPGNVLKLIARHRISMTLLVPMMINAIINTPDAESADLASLELVYYGGSPIQPATLSRAMEVIGCKFLQTYGMTETYAITYLQAEDHDQVNKPHLLTSAGRAALGMELRVVDENDVDTAVGEQGEIICRSENIMDDYLNQPEATATALRGGWMHTGDIGYLDDEGYLFVTDRKSEVIVSGGENVYPREVEDVLFEHPDILEAAVIGVPDEKWGERVHAVLVPRSGADPDAQDVIDFCRERIARYKAPKSVEVMAELPKTATGKVAKLELRKPWWVGHSRGVG